MEENKTLRTCPFCGSEGECIRGYESAYYVVECKDTLCSAQGPFMITEEEAISMWNKRTYSELIITKEALDALNEESE